MNSAIDRHRDSMRSIGFRCLAVLLSLSAMGASHVTAEDAPKSLTMILFKANGQTAEALLLGDPPYELTPDVVFFRGPSGTKIRASRSGQFVPAMTWEFAEVGGRGAFRYFLSSVFYKQDLPIPVIYELNGVTIAGLGDSGARERQLHTAVRKEFKKLPASFQQGLREFYLFCGAATPAVVWPASVLEGVLSDDEDLKPYSVEQQMDNDPKDVEAFQEEMTRR